MSVDLSIHNYNFAELLGLFKVENQLTNKNTNENIKRMKNMLSTIQEQFSNDIYNFYLKAYIIIITIYQLLETNISESEIPFYMNKIKKIKAFEKYDCKSIIEIVYSAPPRKDPPTPILNSNHPTNVILDSFPNSVAPGNLNSIKRITQFQNLNLNTCFRTNYFNSSSCNFQYAIPNEIKNVVSMRLASIEIPNAWYLFSHAKQNNIFKIDVTLNNHLTSYSIIIPDGNYDSESLQHFLNTTYFCESGLDNSLQYIRFTIDHRSFKSRFEIIQDDNNQDKLQFSLIFLEDINQNMMSRLGWTLGFRLPKYLNIDDTIQSEGLFDGAGDKYIYMCLTDYQYNSNSVNMIGFDKSMMDEDVLAKIPMVNGKLSLIIDDNNNPLTKTRRYNGPVNINKLQVKIMDKFGEIIDLNNMDFSFTLELEILYESFNFRDVNA